MPINSKIYVLQHALIPRLTYTSQFIPPHPQQLEPLDKKILKWSGQILRLTPTFPAAVMSSPQLLKIPMPSDAIQTTQLRCFWRSQIRGLCQADTTNRLLQRALRHQSNFTDNRQTATTIMPPTGPIGNCLCAHSIAKIYSDAGLAISQPPAPSNRQISLLTTFP